MESSRQIEERAAAWLAKRDSGDWDGAEESRLAHWLEACTAHYIAFIRLEAAWEQGKRLKALDTQPGVVPPSGRWRFSPFFARLQERDGTGARRTRPFAIAASLLLIAGAGGFLANALLRGDRYITPVGGVASLPIADGSKITLNTDSRIRVALSKAERLIELEQGEAFFEVAKDPSRPFVVVSGGERVVAVGTKFSVRRDGTELRVVVTEGLVRLEREEGSGSTARVSQLPVGSIARATQYDVIVGRKPPQEMEEYLSWRTGYLIFHEISLADAVAEFNRYNAQKMIVNDPEVAAIRFSGKFRTENLDAFVRILESGFPIGAAITADRIVLSSRVPSSLAAGAATTENVVQELAIPE